MSKDYVCPHWDWVKFLKILNFSCAAWNSKVFVSVSSVQKARGNSIKRKLFIVFMYHRILASFFSFYKLLWAMLMYKVSTPREHLFLQIPFGSYSSRARASDYLWRPRRDRAVIDGAPGRFSSRLCVCVCARERETDCLLSRAKSGFNPALSFSSSCLFPSATVLRMGLAEGSFQRTCCTRNFRTQPFLFGWEVVRKVAEEMTELSSGYAEGIAPLPCAGSSAFVKMFQQRGVPKSSDEAVRETTASLPHSSLLASTPVLVQDIA